MYLCVISSYAFPLFQDAADKFISVAEKFHAEYSPVPALELMGHHEFTDHLLELERAFLLPSFVNLRYQKSKSISLMLLDKIKKSCIQNYTEHIIPMKWVIKLSYPHRHRRLVAGQDTLCRTFSSRYSWTFASKSCTSHVFSKIDGRDTGSKYLSGTQVWGEI